ncbi:acetylornithine deacetylase [Thalassospira sp. HF15]|uniref:acetylornithine deacetylase n=1 Tax=Thalassospira sp. HF15 TaxID=2722755 RepID=UPI001431176E|nr:acetylornithine deacetylase [Thalassospira sp. HF15]NIY74872.1 acetylornithine deacetylase [Thalassospira sp. HF15]
MVNAFNFLEKLVSFPSVSRSGNRMLIDWVFDLLKEHGIDATLYPNPSGDRASLFASIGGGGPGGLVLSGHTDVVPVDGQDWTSDPFVLRETNDLLFGRGTADMKGFVACALEAFINAKDQLSAPVHLALSYDEEIGCVGVRPMLDDLKKRGLRPDWVLVGEPTSMKMATGHKGKVAGQATCCGFPTHSALAPQGLNAIHMAADFLGDIRDLQSELEKEGHRDPAYDIPYSTLHAGLIRGGTALNIVPQNCVLDFEIRNVASDNPDQILGRLIDAARRQETNLRDKFPQAAITIDILNDYPGLETSSDAPELAKLKALAAGVGGTDGADPMKVAFGTEGGLFCDTFDVPVAVCGPGSMDQGHKPDEFIARAQMEACRSMLARLLG